MMNLEVWLAYLHVACILGWVVFVTSEAALLRAEWLNGAVIERLARVDRILWICWAAVLLSGLARAFWGFKGAHWYWSQPLLHAKLSLLVLLGASAIPTHQRLNLWLKQWQHDQRLPGAAEIQQVRRRVMVGAHLMLIIPLLGVALARGVWCVDPLIR
ncbi:MAG: DUF2214 family protein [Leptothrix ochracea]|uniref:DUF2214 family protein n=2 Tax=Leptothrix ochracea TaxID=735331 RepID=UPI0034E1C2C5